MIDAEQQDLHLWSLRWASWHMLCRRWAPPVPQNILARMQPSKIHEMRDTELSADLSYFNLAVLAQEESQAKQIFYLYYIYRVKNIKAVAAEMKISPSYFYRQLREFRAKSYRSYRIMMADKEMAEA